MFSEAFVSHFVHNRPHGYSVTAQPCYSVVGTRPTGMLSCAHLFVKGYVCVSDEYAHLCVHVWVSFSRLYKTRRKIDACTS